MLTLAGYVKGIGLLSHSPVNDISLGMNKLASLPLEVRYKAQSMLVYDITSIYSHYVICAQFGLLSTLTSVWLDDNLLDEFPVCLCQLQNLCTLRMTGNSISELPTAFAALENLEILVRG